MADEAIQHAVETRLKTRRGKETDTTARKYTSHDRDTMEADAIILEYVQELYEAVEQHEREKKIQFFNLARDRQFLRDLSNPFALDPEYFRKYYRFTPEVALLLVQLLENRILLDRTTAIPVHLQVLIVLRFLAEGSFQKGFGQDWNHPISQTTASHCVDRVINAINTVSEQFIVFPNNAAERQRIQQSFQQTIRIPGIIGLIDCFVVRFKKPPENEEAFFHYKHATAMNVQIIVDSEYIIRNVRICPGSNTDRFIWQFSEAKDYLEMLRHNENIVEQEGYYYILGDSGYTSSPVLLTPQVHAPPGTREAVYTSEHVRTRWRVEQTIGILSSVWMAINRARKLHYLPMKVANIINACIVLHNIRKLHRIDDEPYEFDVQENAGPIVERHGDYAAGIAERTRLINTYY